MFWYLIEGCNAITGLLIRSPTLPKFQKSGISLPLLIAQESKQIKLVKNSPFLVIKKKAPATIKFFLNMKTNVRKKKFVIIPHTKMVSLTILTAKNLPYMDLGEQKCHILQKGK